MTLACLLLAAAPIVAQEAPQTPKRSPGVASVTYVVEVDATRAKKVGWGGEDAGDAQLVERAIAVVTRRLAAMERSFRLQPTQGRAFELTMPQIQPRDRELFADMLESVGLCEFLMFAEDDSASALGIDLAKEKAKLEAWQQAHAGAALDAFNALGGDAGPDVHLLWCPTRFVDQVGPPAALLLPAGPEDHIGGASFERVYRAEDQYGYPAIGLDTSAARMEDFRRVTSANQNHRLGIVIEGTVRSAPNLMTGLEKSAMIEGRFGADEAGELANSIRKRLGPLKVTEIR